MTATGMPPTDIRKKVLQRLLDKHDPAKSKHKPLSLLRAELRRAASQLIEQEAPELADAEFDELIDGVLDEVPGLGPLEDLFRDEAVSEFLILSPQQVIRRDGANWLPTSVQFRDNDHLRTTLKQLLRSAEPIGDVPTTSDGGADAVLANGFRLITILPPRVLEISALAVFRRPTTPGIDATPPPTRITTLGSGIAATAVPRPLEHHERLRVRITERFIERLAANGVFDISALPVGELRRIIASYVAEFNGLEHLNLDNAAQDRLTLEILAGMNR